MVSEKQWQTNVRVTQPSKQALSYSALSVAAQKGKGAEKASWTTYITMEQMI